MTTTTSHQGGDGPAPAGPFICRRSMHYDRGRRLHEACGYTPPAEFEAAYHASLQAEDRGRVKSNQPSLHETQGGSHGPVGSIHVARVAPHPTSHARAIPRQSCGIDVTAARSAVMRCDDRSALGDNDLSASQALDDRDDGPGR